MATYYVDADPTRGDDAHDGLTEETPWRTLAKVSEEFTQGTFQGGDRILLRRGETWAVTDGSSALNLKGSSGSFGNHIYIGPYGSGADPHITHSGTAATFLVGRWTGDAAANYITIEGLELSNGYGSSMILIRDCSYWIVRECVLHDSDPGPSDVAPGIMVQHNAHHVWIENCEVYNVDEGIYIGRSTSPTQTDYTRRVTVRDCWLHDNNNEGVDLKGISTSCFVVDTDFQDNGIGAGHDASQFDIGGQHHRVAFCRFMGSAGSNQYGLNFFYTYSGVGCRYIKVDRCLFKDCGGSSGAAVRARSDDNYLTNLTIVGGSGHGMEIESSGWGTAQHVKNCIFDSIAGGKRPVYFLNTSGLDRYDLDHNTYGDVDPVWYYGSDRTLTWVQAQDRETNGQQSDPDFADVENYELNAASPCVDAGDTSSTTWDWTWEYGPGAPSGAVDMGWRECGRDLPHRVFDTVFATLDDFSDSHGVTLSTTAAFHGSTGGLIRVTDTASRYVCHSGLGNMDYLYTRLYFNPDGLAMANGDEFTLIELRDASDNVLGRVNLNCDRSSKRVRAGITADNDDVGYTGYSDIAPGWNQVELFWMRSPYPQHANWGEIILFLNGHEVSTVTDVDNDERHIDKVYAGAISGLDAGTSGELCVDLLTLDEVREIGVCTGPDQGPDEPASLWELILELIRLILEWIGQLTGQ